MVAEATSHQRLDHLTHRGNSKHTRYGWLRLTPAFSVHLIRDLVRGLPSGARVIDPFCGTGTTALVCSEEGIEAATTDINPFLLWLGSAKCATYPELAIRQAQDTALDIEHGIGTPCSSMPWVPPLFQIEKWWDPQTLQHLSGIRARIAESGARISEDACNLLKVAFCRVMIETSNASFGHQSMSFKQVGAQMNLLVEVDSVGEMRSKWKQSTDRVIRAATSPIRAKPCFRLHDARAIAGAFGPESFECVITSPPYPNRMSYIRELRPYMYWLGYLTEARQAGELDWEAIGGTWGCATSNLGKWSRPTGASVPYAPFEDLLRAVAGNSHVLSKYIEKYFVDMVDHVRQLYRIVAPGGSVHYIVGNSKFYEVLVPVQDIFASMFDEAGFRDIRVEVLRKRTSKKELFEYMVVAKK